MNLRIIIFSCVLLFFSSCKKANIDLTYSTIAFINGITIHDIIVLSDTAILFCGATNLDQGRIGTYTTTTKKTEFTKTDQIMNGLTSSSDILWACGNNMCMLKSTDAARSWQTAWDSVGMSEFFNKNQYTNITKMYAVDSTPVFAIGYKHMLEGNLYVQNNNSLISFTTKSLNMGVNDMLVVDSTEIFVAGYGSIVHMKNTDAPLTYCSIGNENFTGITQVGRNSLVACTQSGALYTYNGIDSVWKKNYTASMSLTHVIGDIYGNLIAVGNGRHVLVSNNYGENWHKVRYPNSKNITCLTFDVGYFWAGTSNGEIIRFNTVQIEK